MDQEAIEVEVISFEDADYWGGAEHLVVFHPDKEDRLIGELPLERLSDFNPFDNVPWHDADGFSMEGVQRALEEETFVTEPYSAEFAVHKRNWGAKRHEARVAYLIKHGFDDPISLQFNTGDGYSNSIDDGHHRLSAAFFRQDESVNVELGGWLSASVRAFGIIIPKYQRLGEIDIAEDDMDDELEFKP